jgi:hypothetical protein
VLSPTVYIAGFLEAEYCMRLTLKLRDLAYLFVPSRHLLPRALKNSIQDLMVVGGSEGYRLSPLLNTMLCRPGVFTTHSSCNAMLQGPACGSAWRTISPHGDIMFWIEVR